jgi:hypothetical protein
MHSTVGWHEIVTFLSGASQLIGSLPDAIYHCVMSGTTFHLLCLCLSENKREVDPWSLVWYMASFGGLVTFFLVVSCSECCCSKRATRTPRSVSTTRPVELPPEVTQWVDETPPPPYHLFAPPSYDTLFYGSVSEDKMKCEIYVVPVHNHMVTLQRAASSMPPEPT